MHVVCTELYLSVEMTDPTGSEGTLGVITKVSIQLITKPTSTHVMLLKVTCYLFCISQSINFCRYVNFQLRNFSELSTILTYCRQNLNEIISAVEFIDALSLFVLQQMQPSLFAR